MKLLITLDSKLKVIDQLRYEISKKDFIEKHSDKHSHNRETLSYITDNLPEMPRTFHSNYLGYLEKCWATHYNVVLTPDIIWYTLLCELALIIAEKPEVYRSLFTDSDKQKNISVAWDEPEVLPLYKIAAELKRLVPNQLSESFLLKFSTSTDRSELAHQAAFADAVSPYYSYSIFCCGISAIRVDGTKEDWGLLNRSWVKITEKLSSLDDSNDEYFQKVDNIIIPIPDGNVDFFKKMFYSERCGSGSETEVFGWFTDLFRKQPEGVRKSTNFSSHVSLVNYDDLDTGLEYVLKAGLFHSSVVGEALEPDFGYVCYRKNEATS